MNLVRKCTQEVETPLRKLYNKPDHEVGRYSGKKGWIPVTFGYLIKL